jgi:hypothetical protein
MKRGILVATLMVTVAGVASANLLTEESRTAASVAAVARYAPQPAAEPITAPLLAPAAPVSVTRTPASQEQTKVGSQKASVEARQAPVPLQVRSRATINARLPTVEALIAAQSADAKDADKDSEQAAADPAAASNDGFSEARAKAAIEADGYKGVTVLRKGQNGIWHAKALRGQTEVKLTVDASGSVAAD